MAEPWIDSISPNTGLPGGRYLLTIIGGDFELPPSPPVAGFVGGGVPETVRIEINGERAAAVKVWTDGLITCLAPAFRGDPALLSAAPGLDVDVVITNLTGPESATYDGAFTYARQDFTRGDGPLAHVLRTLLREFRRQVLEYIAFSTQVDFDGSTADLLDVIELSRVPAIGLFGPKISENKFRRSCERPVSRDEPNLEFSVYRGPRVVDMEFEATIHAKGETQAAHLAEEFVQFFERNQRLSVDRDPDDASKGRVEFDMFLTDGPSRSGSPNDSDVLSYSATFRIEGVSIDADSPIAIDWGSITADSPEALEMQEERL